MPAVTPSPSSLRPIRFEILPQPPFTLAGIPDEQAFDAGHLAATLPEVLASLGHDLQRIGEFVAERAHRDFDRLAELALGGQY